MLHCSNKNTRKKKVILRGTVHIIYLMKFQGCFILAIFTIIVLNIFFMKDYNTMTKNCKYKTA